MRTGLITVALAVGALAVPYQKREIDIETAVDVVYVTSIVTVTATGAPPAAAVPTPPAKHFHGHPSKPPASPPTEAEPTSSIETRAAESAAPTASSGGSSSGSSYSDIAVFHHNLHRQNHSAPDIEWDSALEASAATIAASCIYAHNTAVAGGGYGQNIAAGVEPTNISAIITDLFYNGEVNYYNGLYGQANPSMTNFESWGHFSQIVWKGTTKVGCATQDCSGQGLANVGGDVPPYFTVCNYASPGNFAGEYGDNVGEPLGHATAQWNTGDY